MNQLSEAFLDIVRWATGAAKDTAHRASIAAKDVSSAVEDVAGEVTHATAFGVDIDNVFRVEAEPRTLLLDSSSRV